MVDICTFAFGPPTTHEWALFRAIYFLFMDNVTTLLCDYSRIGTSGDVNILVVGVPWIVSSP